MGRPNHSILILVIVVATSIVALIATQVLGMLKSGTLPREEPLSPLTRSQHPAFFWGIVGVGTIGALVLSGVIATAGYWLISQ